MRLEQFIGAWAITRRIVQGDGTEAGFAGRAVLTPEGAGLTYREAGLLTLPGAAPLRAERSYLWRGTEGGIRVLFADGRHFHDFGAATPEATHWCDPDDYRVRYDFFGWPCWRAEWQVRGPRKDYRMISDYMPDERQGALPPDPRDI